MSKHEAKEHIREHKKGNDPDFKTRETHKTIKLEHPTKCVRRQNKQKIQKAKNQQM